MINKLTYLIPIDTCKVWLTQLFHKYIKHQLKSIYLGFFGKVCVKKSKNYFFLKKKKYKCFLLWQNTYLSYPGSNFYKIYFNSNILLKKRLTPRGKIIMGPNTFLLKRKKFISSFVNIL